MRLIQSYTIEKLLENFTISKAEQHQRDEYFEQFAASFDNLLIDEFVEKYLLPNPQLTIYLGHTDGAMFVKKLKEFIVFILTAPFDAVYLQRIHFISSVHYSIKLDPPKVSYGFLALSTIIDRLANINAQVMQHKAVIVKIFKLVEFAMNDGYYLEQLKEQESTVDLSFENGLHSGLKFHKNNMRKIQDAIKTEDLSPFDTIEKDAKDCQFSDYIQQAKQKKEYIHFSDEDIKTIEQQHHNNWHNHFTALIQFCKNNQTQQMQKQFVAMQANTKALEAIINKEFKALFEDDFLALQSSIEVMQNITKLFHHKESEISQNYIEYLQKKLSKEILLPIEWAMKEIVVQYDTIDEQHYTVVKQMRHNGDNIFIGIVLENNSRHLQKMFLLILESFDTYLLSMERERSLIAFADKAQSANKAKDMFLANMSHELRTPLNAVIGFSQILMADQSLPQKTKSFIENINIAGNNLLLLVNTILDFAKLESGKMNFQPKLTNIAAILDEVKVLVSTMAEKKSIKLSIAKVVSLNLYMDEKLLKQAFVNLLSNAIKFTPDGGEVALRIHFEAAKKRYLFEVKDTGTGLSKDEIGKLFQEFVQIENSYQKEHAGTGLGLAITKNIVEKLHHGALWVESEPQKGSSFFIALPTPTIESHTYVLQNSDPDAKHILIAEDSKAHQKILTNCLEKKYTLTITDTINKTKKLLSKERFDYVILDFFLLDGISSEILKFMEEESIEIQTIVISAENEIDISSSLSNSSNLECIINKTNIDEICKVLQ